MLSVSSGEKGMDKLGGALYEIHHLEDLAEQDRWLNRIHPLAKLILTVCYIAITISFPKYDLAGLLCMGVYPIALFILGEISLRDSLRRLRIVLPLVCLAGLCNPFFDRQVILEVGGFAVTTGMVSMLTLMAKGIYSVLASYLLIVSTSIEKICYAMRLLHVPSVLVTQILLTYRYVSLLLAEANRMMQAYVLRAPGQKGVHFKVWGSLAGQLLLRSMDRASEVYESMSLRGYRGEFHYVAKGRWKGKDCMYLMGWCLLFLLLRFW